MLRPAAPLRVPPAAPELLRHFQAAENSREAPAQGAQESAAGRLTRLSLSQPRNICSVVHRHVGTVTSRRSMKAQLLLAPAPAPLGSAAAVVRAAADPSGLCVAAATAGGTLHLLPLQQEETWAAADAYALTLLPASGPGEALVQPWAALALLPGGAVAGGLLCAQRGSARLLFCQHPAPALELGQPGAEAFLLGCHPGEMRRCFVCRWLFASAGCSPTLPDHLSPLLCPSSIQMPSPPWLPAPAARWHCLETPAARCACGAWQTDSSLQRWPPARQHPSPAPSSCPLAAPPQRTRAAAWCACGRPLQNEGWSLRQSWRRQAPAAAAALGELCQRWRQRAACLPQAALMAPRCCGSAAAARGSLRSRRCCRLQHLQLSKPWHSARMPPCWLPLPVAPCPSAAPPLPSSWPAPSWPRRLQRCFGPATARCWPSCRTARCRNWASLSSRSWRRRQKWTLQQQHLLRLAAGQGRACGLQRPRISRRWLTRQHQQQLQFQQWAAWRRWRRCCTSFRPSRRVARAPYRSCPPTRCCVAPPNLVLAAAAAAMLALWSVAQACSLLQAAQQPLPLLLPGQPRHAGSPSTQFWTCVPCGACRQRHLRSMPRQQQRCHVRRRLPSALQWLLPAAWPTAVPCAMPPLAPTVPSASSRQCLQRQSQRGVHTACLHRHCCRQRLALQQVRRTRSSRVPHACQHPPSVSLPRLGA